MSDKKKVIITIARQYGSGGADTGRKLAEDLGISFYDKNITYDEYLDELAEKEIK